MTTLLALPARATAQDLVWMGDDALCDVAYQNCRRPLIDLIEAETQGIDVSFWFMEDQRYTTALVKKLQQGVPVRVVMDTDANAGYPLNKTRLAELEAGGIPMREKTTGGVLHRKFMIFHGQNTVEFSGANYSPDAFVYNVPYENYVDEAIYFTRDAKVVNSFRTVFDNMWTATSGYANYKTTVKTPLTRAYPTSTIDPELNFPASQNYATRAVNAYNAEKVGIGPKVGIDVQMYRITDVRHADAMIAATKRGVPVRIYTDTFEYRNVSRLWHAWNVDRLWLAGIPLRVPAKEGLNHQKTILLYGQGMTIFGSSNWTTASANSQDEHNYFTRKKDFFDWFTAQFERKWNNSAGFLETKEFVPLPPDRPVYSSPANMATGVPTTGGKLVWYGGPWAHLYDIYFGTDPNPQTPLAPLQALGPSETTSQKQSFMLPELQPGTTYYWKVVSKTAALIQKDGPVWSLTTAGTPPPPPPPPAGATNIVMWMANVPPSNLSGNWAFVADHSAAGGSALWNKNHGAAKIAPALTNPAHRVERTFTATAGVPYRVWMRMKAEGNSLANDSLHVQFDKSVDSLSSPLARINSASSLEFVLQRGTADPSVAGWGWTDNGWGAAGAPVYFATSGTQTMRVQQREDGPIVDQILLTPDMNYVPGASDNDATVLATTDTASTACSTAMINPTSQDFSAAAGSGTTNVTADSSCSWTAASNGSSWLTIPAGSAGTGTGTVAFSVAQNTGAARTGTLTVAGQTLTVNQAAADVPVGSDTEIVLRTSEASVIVGAWTLTADATAATGTSLVNPNLAAAKVAGASANPASYFEMTFDAQQGVPYHFWMRGKAASNSWANDSVYVQFDQTVDASNNPAFRIGTTDSTPWTLEDCTNCGVAAWGWQDNGNSGTVAPAIFFAQSGPQRIRVQVREDGIALDQIVISSAKYLNSAPGAVKNDTTTQP